MSKLSKAQMHQRPTYETLVRDTILEPKDKIALPDRQATLLRSTQQLSRYDDAEFLDLEKDNAKIKQAQAQEAAIKTEAGNDTGGSLGQTRAEQPGPHQGHNFTQPPAAQPPPSGSAHREGRARHHTHPYKLMQARADHQTHHQKGPRELQRRFFKRQASDQRYFKCQQAMP